MGRYGLSNLFGNQGVFSSVVDGKAFDIPVQRWKGARESGWTASKGIFVQIKLI